MSDIGTRRTLLFPGPQQQRRRGQRRPTPLAFVGACGDESSDGSADNGDGGSVVSLLHPCATALLWHADSDDEDEDDADDDEGGKDDDECDEDNRCDNHASDSNIFGSSSADSVCASSELIGFDRMSARISVDVCADALAAARQHQRMLHAVFCAPPTAAVAAAAATAGVCVCVCGRIRQYRHMQ